MSWPLCRQKAHRRSKGVVTRRYHELLLFGRGVCTHVLTQKDPPGWAARGAASSVSVSPAASPLSPHPMGRAVAQQMKLLSAPVKGLQVPHPQALKQCGSQLCPQAFRVEPASSASRGASTSASSKQVGSQSLRQGGGKGATRRLVQMEGQIGKPLPHP